MSMKGFGSLIEFKGTVNVISSNPPCKDCKSRFTAVAWTPLSDQIYRRYCCFIRFKSVLCYW